jgi:hypothetical protein
MTHRHATLPDGHLRRKGDKERGIVMPRMSHVRNLEKESAGELALCELLMIVAARIRLTNGLEFADDEAHTVFALIEGEMMS